MHPHTHTHDTLRIILRRQSCPLSSCTSYFDILSSSQPYCLNQEVLLLLLFRVTVSLVTIKGTDCRVAELGNVASRTGGQVTLVDPLTVVEEFTSILANPVLATDVITKIIIHKGLYVNTSSLLQRPILFCDDPCVAGLAHVVSLFCNGERSVCYGITFTQYCELTRWL